MPISVSPLIRAVAENKGRLMECVVLVDNSNIFIEARKLSAMRLGLSPAIPGRAPQDPNWRLDYSELLTCLAEGRKIRKAFLVGSRPPPNDRVWKLAERGGFEVKTHDRDSNNREKAVDSELVAQGTRIICTTPPAVLVVASGDRDFIPLVRIAHDEGWTVEMAAFESAFSRVGEMAKTVDRIRPLDDVFDKIGRTSTLYPGGLIRADRCHFRKKLYVVNGA
jgi:uncharacterized LabA/DUF88 family protein